MACSNDPAISVNGDNTNFTPPHPQSDKTVPSNAAYGLTEAATRKGWRETEDTQRGSKWLSERMIFRDPSTGGILWRMTCDPSVETVDYYDIPAWNADGSLMLFNSGRTPGEKWIMNSNGESIRELNLPVEGRGRSNYWSVIDPLKIFFSYFKEGKTTISAMDPISGSVSVITTADGDLGSMMPPHPSEEWFVFVRTSGERSDSQSTVSLVGADGTVEKLELEKRTHRIRFTKSPDRRLFFNFDDPRTTYTILPDGSQRYEIPNERGSHPGWTRDGKELTIFSSVDLHGWSFDGKNRRVIADLGNGGHGTSCPDDIWLYSDIYPFTKGKYPNCLLAIKLDGSQTVVTIAKPFTSMRKPVWHTQSHSTHPHPVSSPDGTKFFYNSDALSQFSDTYVAVVRPPDPPKNLNAKIVDNLTLLSWEKSFRNNETRGYNIYRAEQSGIDYQRLTDTPVKGLSWEVPANYKGGHYIVTAVEHCGLEGVPSNEVYGGGNKNWKGAVRVTFEAESGKSSVPMREAIDPVNASGGWFMSVPGAGDRGNLQMGITVPEKADYIIWARVRGKDSGQIKLDENQIASFEAGGSSWTWKLIKGHFPMLPGEHSIMIEGADFDIDKILVTNDKSFHPQGVMKLDNTSPPVPAGITSNAISANAVNISWEKSTGANTADIDHYNVYCSDDGNFKISQSSLIGSPSECEMVDWGLPLNSTKFYRVTAVDRSGNESLPSVPVRAAVKQFRPTSVRLTAEAAKTDGMKPEPVSPVAKESAATVLLLSAEKGEASWTFDIPKDGEYAIWVLSTHYEVPMGQLMENQRMVPSTGESIFNIDLDNGSIITRERTRGPWNEWNWTPAGNKPTGTPQRFNLKAGRHTINLNSASDKANVAQVMITDDPSWYPVEGMSLLGVMPPVTR